MKLLAHITEDNGKRKEQELREHCLQTAQYAAESMGDAPFYNLAYLAGLIHDMGKAKQEFQDYLEAAYRNEDVKKGSVVHTFAAVIFLFEKYHTARSSGLERMTCELVAYAAGAHHGMFDCVDMNGGNGFAYRLKKSREEIDYSESVTNYLRDVADEAQLEKLFLKAVEEVESFFSEAIKTYSPNKKNIYFQLSMLARLLLSGVIYGDRRDTGEFMNQHGTKPEQKMVWEEQRAYFERKLAGLHTDSEINRVRKDISEQCLKFADRPDGIYKLHVPTGAGKTLSSLRYALAHAERYKKRRIIFIIPLLSVLDQNVKVIRDYLKDPDSVLEHHSNLIHPQNTKEKADSFEFLAESWQAPVIVSTLVQLLEILFSHKKTAAARMQSLCDSVIVIDEVQSLPKKMTVMFNLAMNFLHQFCNASIVLSSATQPCFDELKWPLHLSDDPDMVRLDDAQKKVFERAQIISKVEPGGMNLNECGEFCGSLMERHASLLVICNTKREAEQLTEILSEQASQNDWGLYHLSTSMCQKHRMDVLKRLSEGLTEIQAEAQEQKPRHRLICVATQLMEAGVDLSFEGVVRVLAGIDNLAQAAGRCNRSNEYGKRGCVYLINLKNENLSMLQEIASAQRCTEKVLEFVRQHPEESCIGEKAARNFYRCMFRETEKDILYPAVIDGTTVSLAGLLSNCHVSAANAQKEGYILCQPFKTIGQAFRVFDQDTVDVLAPYQNGKEVIEKLRGMESNTFNMDDYKKIMSCAKKYAVSLFRWQKDQLEQAGLLFPILDERIFILDEKAYDEATYGVRNQKEQAVENYIL